MNGTSTYGETPFLSLWFGNFFEPFYSDGNAVRKAIGDIADLGFTAINLDSKPWEDFFARYRGAAASQYVAMQELMMEQARSRGLDYSCLALYLCGDNLYPTIRDVPSVRGEDAIRPDGTSMGTYKYWSPRAQDTMIEHVEGLLQLYGSGMKRRQDGRVVMQTMFDPIAKPSFDAEGREKYLTWLKERYAGDIGALNERYRLEVSDFGDLAPDQYWLRPGELAWASCARPSAADFRLRTPDFYRWLDNQSHLAEVTVDYFATMHAAWKARGIYAEPVLHQWGYFFNPPGQPDWATGGRALDIFEIAPHVDGVLFIAAPLNAENRPDAMAVSVESSIARSANGGKAFTGGLYIGRHVNTDIYRQVPPAEAIATHIAGGANGLHVYGYSGLDDGGVMYRMDEGLRTSVREGNEWAAQVIPLLAGHSRSKEVAILFPAEMSLYEPLEVDDGGRHRMDLLGWYQQFADLGWQVDVVHPSQVIAGALSDYRCLVVPTNSLYDVGDNVALESAVRRFVEDGGTVFHGPDCLLAHRALGVLEEQVEFDCIGWREEVIPHGWSTVAYDQGEPLATYLQSGKTAIACTGVGEGKVYSIGFEYGYAYCRQTMPIVPPRYGNREMHPVVLLERTPVEEVVGVSPLAPCNPVKGLEIACFGDRYVLVNHRATAVDIRGIPSRREISLAPGVTGWIAPHSAVYVEV